MIKIITGHVLYARLTSSRSSIHCTSTISSLHRRMHTLPPKKLLHPCPQKVFPPHLEKFAPPQKKMLIGMPPYPHWQLCPQTPAAACSAALRTLSLTSPPPLNCKHDDILICFKFDQSVGLPKDKQLTQDAASFLSHPVIATLVSPATRVFYEIRVKYPPY